MGGMQAHDRAHAVEPFRQRDRSAAAFQACSYCNNAVHPGLVCGCDDLLEVFFKIRVIQVRVCVDEHGLIVR